jgi:glucose-6-phosphate 1-dehydrogenase
MSEKKMPDNSIALVIFGVTGDLARRKLIPGIFQLLQSGKLDSELPIIGFARRPWTTEMMRENLKQGIIEFSRTQPVPVELMDKLLSKSIYVQSPFEDEHGYGELKGELLKGRFKGVVFYLATPPNEYLTIINKIGQCGLNHLAGWVRIVVEKPFGYDLNSALELEKNLHQFFNENEVFRIDHYLGKETVQNILVLRFANGIFEPLWNGHYIDHIQITVSETLGVGTRAGYFDSIGIIRDMFANHLLQLVTLTAMEVPSAFNANSVRDEKIKVLKSLRPLKGKDAFANTIRGQYGPGVIEGGTVGSYLDEPGVLAHTLTETYLAARLHIDNWRWAGVPFYIRCGKRMPFHATEIVIHFKQVPLALFDWKNLAGIAPNTLVIRIQPDEGISLTIGAKRPGFENQISPVKMEFCYQDAFGVEPPEAYERLLLDCINGDATLFTRTDEVIEQWSFTQSILDGWKTSTISDISKYPSGTWGPQNADHFIQKDGRSWTNPN